jgi:hypothetical protein
MPHCNKSGTLAWKALPGTVNVKANNAEESNAVSLGCVAVLRYPVERFLLGDFGRWPTADGKLDPGFLHAFGEVAIAL